jgi:import receptor subunit TOM70
MQNREPRLPSFTFISAYFAAFRPRKFLSALYLKALLSFCLGEHPQLPESPSTGDNTLQLAFDALDAADYAHAVSLVNEAMEQGVSWDDGKAEAYNLRGTFKYVLLDHLLRSYLIQ